MFAAASAGASLIPSPIIMVGWRARSASTAATFSAGLLSEKASSSLRDAATALAASKSSPVTMMTRDMPEARSLASAAGVSSRMASAMRANADNRSSMER